MKRTLKNILMILLILVLLFLTYFTIGYLKGDFSLNSSKAIELNAHVIYMAEENDTTTETVDENGNITTIIDDGTGDGNTEIVTTGEVDPDTTVTNEDDVLYTATDDENVDISATSGLAENDNSAKKLGILYGGLSYIYYIAFGIVSLLFGFTFAYLAYSKFNKLTFKETFYSAGRTTMYIIYSLSMSLMYFVLVNNFLNY